MNAGRRLVAGGVIAALAGTIVTAGGAFADTTAPSPAAAVSPDRTSAAESRKVDAVPTPVLAWSACFEIAECATVRLPLDYDQPRGATTEVAVLRVKAKDQANKIGSLFVNPGGPSIPATKLALAAPSFMSDELLDRFDIVGVDPRGIGSSQNVRCFASGEDQASALDNLGVPFPVSKAEKQAYIKGV
ncbi:hypothetical protein ABT120_16065 [Nonomuraea angiospora]|uniref:hypothetical protein n=1 Tax=Nonomuraea angiospora TaxID=46172 RepID=UPI00331C1215